MTQRRKPSRRGSRRKQRRWSLLAKLATVATIAGVLIAFLSWRSETQATDREHESRRADATKQDYDKLKASLALWDTAARDAYDASESVYLRTGRWPSARELGMHRPVYRAHAKVQILQDGLTDSRLVRLLDAWHDDIRALCAARSRPAAERASKAMVGHRRQANARIKKLVRAETKQLGMLG